MHSVSGDLTTEEAHLAIMTVTIPVVSIVTTAPSRWDLDTLMVFLSDSITDGLIIPVIHLIGATIRSGEVLGAGAGVARMVFTADITMVITTDSGMAITMEMAGMVTITHPTAHALCMVTVEATTADQPSRAAVLTGHPLKIQLTAHQEETGQPPQAIQQAD